MEGFKELELKYRTIEADLTRFLSKNSHFPDQESAFEKIAEQYSSALIESNNRKRIIMGEMDQIKGQIKKCHEYTNCIIPDIPNEHVTAKFQQELETAHSLVSEFKKLRTDEYEEICKQEASLKREIDLTTRRATEIERNKEASHEKENLHKKRTLKNGMNASNSRDEAVQQFQDYVAKHGHCGSWNMVDHSVFIKTWKRVCSQEYKDNVADVESLEHDAAVMDEFQQALPGRTMKDISEHLQWYQRYYKLEHGQRTAIQKWKKERKKRLEEYRSGQLKKAAVAQETNAKSNEKINVIAATKKARIEKWKREKAQAEEQLRLQELARRELEEKKKKKEIAERRKILQERDLQRQRDSDALKRVREQEKEMEIEYKRKKGAEANAKVKGLTARDLVSRQHLTREKQESERMKRIEEQIKETRRKQRNDQLADWDPTRVYQPTSSHQRRLMSTENPSQPTRTFILQPGGRAQASWRAGL